MNFNKEQWHGIIRTGIAFIGGILIAKGALPADFDVSKLTESVVAIIGAIGSFVVLWNSISSRTDKKQIASVAAMQDVSQITIKPTVTSTSVASAVEDQTPPFKKVVLEGTQPNA